MDIYDSRYGEMLTINADNVVSRSIRLYGEWAQEELNVLSQIITPGSCVLDVGAYIGTHTIAFSNFVGDKGKVYSFEPRKEIFSILSKNIELNACKNVTSFNMALGDREHTIALEAINLNDSNNFGGLALSYVIDSKEPDCYEMNVKTIDSLSLATIDFIKMDVEGMEREILDGAIKTIQGDRPIVFCECNSLMGGNDVFKFGQIWQYCVFGILTAGFNVDNYNKNQENIFGLAKEFSLLLIPEEKAEKTINGIKCIKLLPINDLEDLVLPLLHKPQYPYEVLVNTGTYVQLGISFPSPAIEDVIKSYDIIIDDIDRALQSSNEIIKIQLEHNQTLTASIEASDKELIRRKEEIKQQNYELNQKNSELNQKNEEISQKIEEINHKNEELNQKDSLLNQKNEELNQKNEEISQIMVSRSWRITKPLRAIYKFLKNFSLNLVLRKLVWYSSKVIFHLLPFSGRANEGLKKVFFSKFPGLYNTIKSSEIGCYAAYNATSLGVSIQENNNRIIQKIAFNENIPISEIPVKVLAFYLPQFHAIPENDAWWGEGFTEWTNVKPAQPLFEGHYQPHIPGELGYYDLLDVKIQERQVKLAKNYGIGGFCFHYYWFNGKRLLEKPIENYLLNLQLDLPFCISWANENWTRRWDGRENKILIKQNHSPEDDLAFIQHISKYMFDNRYIRINNKPLLIVYRPGLLPSAKETAESWRNWCRANGIGEIYLAYVQSFENPHPSEIGYDAAIEFPPNSFNPLIVTHLIKPYINDFKCNVFDWETMVRRSENYDLPDYKLFRGVCPSWDNTPRSKGESHIFINNHPDDFQKWVYNAAKDTVSRFENLDERLVFVNAWNEWAEGAHLEPDEKYGYAYLQCIYESLSHFSLQDK